MHRVGSLIVCDDDDGWDLGGAREEGNVQGTGGGGESRDTTTPTGKCQVPSCLFKGGGILQVRQQLADKGEDHAGFSLAVAEDSVCGTEVRVNYDFGGRLTKPDQGHRSCRISLESRLESRNVLRGGTR